jgi:hypothetical protein
VSVGQRTILCIVAVVPKIVSDLATYLASELDVSVERVDDGAVIGRSDRRIVVTPRDGPGGRRAWTVVVRNDGTTVSKFGLFHSHDAVRTRVRTLLETEVGYTVCCDG